MAKLHNRGAGPCSRGRRTSIKAGQDVRTWPRTVREVVDSVFQKFNTDSLSRGGIANNAYNAGPSAHAEEHGTEPKQPGGYAGWV
jgi:hypothetical protein